jgi:fatty-acyl-CoA synthase
MTSTADTALAAGAIAEPLRSRRNTWNTQVAVHAQMKPDAVAFRYRGTDTTWAQLHRRIEALADALARRGWVGATACSS